MVNIDANKENICINKVVGQKRDFVFVQGDSIIPDIKPDILNAVSTSGNAYIYKKEIQDGKIKLDGTIDAYVIYLADDDVGSTRGIQTSINFSQVIQMDGITENMSVDESVQIKTMECNVLNGRKINVKVGIELGVTAYTNENVDIITSFNDDSDIQTLVKPISVISLVGEGTSKTYAKENIQIDENDSLAEILNVNVNIINRDRKISYNKVLAKGDAEVKILYLTEAGEIKCVTNNIQIMGFVDIDNISEDAVCNIQYKVKNILIKPNQTEEHSIYAEIEIELVCRAYQIISIEFISDLYSTSDEITYNQRNVRIISKKDNMIQKYNLRSDIKLPEGRICDINIVPMIKDLKVANSRINYEGDAELNVLMQSNNRIENVTQKIPFNFSVDYDGVSSNTALNTEIDITNSSFNTLSNGETDVNIDMLFNIDLSMDSNINIIDDINIDESRSCNSYSMIIYFVKPGDTLWKIAKKFKSTVSDIMRVNNIEDENKIYPSEQLFIPKYVCTKREISA